VSGCSRGLPVRAVKVGDWDAHPGTSGPVIWQQVAGLSVRAAARELKVSPSVLQRARHDAAGEAQHA
jgi:hypothetical protein